MHKSAHIMPCYILNQSNMNMWLVLKMHFRKYSAQIWENYIPKFEVKNKIK